jgi:raffinose/stachyose/melibiose transport system substrate-binding protein
MKPRHIQTGMDRRKFLTLAGLAGAGLAAGGTLAGCGSSGGGGGAPGAYSVQFWDAFENSSEQDFFTTEFVTAFNNTHKNIQLDLTVKQIQTLFQAVTTALAAGSGPDIIEADGSSQVLPMAKAGQLLPLDDYATKFGWDKLILPWAFEASKFQGKLWSLPNAYETMVIYNNPATYEKYGWQQPQNMDDLESLMADAAGHGIQPITAGNADWKGANEWFVTMMWNHYAGPDALYQALSGQIKWTDPVFVDAITALNGWFQKGYIGKSVDDYFTYHFPQCYTLLAQQKAAMYWSGTWELATLPSFFGAKASNDQTWSWFPTPPMTSGVPAELYELSIGGTFSVNAKTKNPDAVTEYLAWYFANSPAFARGLKQFGQEPPPVTLTAADFPAGTNPNDSRVYERMGACSTKGLIGYTTWTFWPPKSDTYIINSFEDVITGKMTPAQYCSGLQSVFEQEFSQHLVPALFKPAAY